MPSERARPHPRCCLSRPLWLASFFNRRTAAWVANWRITRWKLEVVAVPQSQLSPPTTTMETSFFGAFTRFLKSNRCRMKTGMEMNYSRFLRPLAAGSCRSWATGNARQPIWKRLSVAVKQIEVASRISVRIAVAEPWVGIARRAQGISTALFKSRPMRSLPIWTTWDASERLPSSRTSRERSSTYH